MEKLARYSTFDIRTAAVDPLKHDFEYQTTNSIFVIRYSIFELPLLIILLGSKTFFGTRKVTEYQVFNIKTNF